MTQNNQRRGKRFAFYFKIFFIISVAFIISGGFIFALIDLMENNKVNWYQGVKDHLDVILAIQNPLDIFPDNSGKTIFALIDLIFSYLFIPTFLALLSDYVIKRLNFDMEMKLDDRLRSYILRKQDRCPTCSENVEYSEDNGKYIGKCKNGHKIEVEK